VVACAAGAWYIGVFIATRAPVDNSQHEFGAAVAMACGRGFVDPGYDATPGLNRFLTNQSDRFECSELPGTLPAVAPNVTQRLYRYLMSAGALVWMARGTISWSGLSPLYGMLYAFTIAGAYGLFRIGMRSRLLAALLSVALTASAIHLSQLAYIRDYAKAPFIIALILVMARMACGEVTRGRVLGYAAAFGVILGLGFGFRNDLLINVPPFLAVVFVGLRTPLRKNLALKAAAAGVAAAAFVVVAWPVMRAYQSGSNTGHVALLGLMTTFDTPLAIRGSIYDWGYTYLDGFVATTINSHSYRVLGHPAAYLSPEYDRLAVAYLLQICRDWPADMLVRAYASILKVLEMPFTIGSYTNAIPYGASGPIVEAVYGWQMWALRFVSGGGVIMAALALTIVAGTSLRTAFTLLAFLLYYAGYPAIQFHIRHFFHLEFIAWLALGFVVDRAIGLFWTAGRAWWLGGRLDTEAWRRGVVRAALFVLATTVGVAGGLKALRTYQEGHVRALLRAYSDAPLERLPTEALRQGDKTLVVSPGLWNGRLQEAPVISVGTQYLVLEFSPTRCDAVRLPLTLKYAGADITNDFSRKAVVTIPRGSAPTRMFFPAYDNPQGPRFEGIELPRQSAGCLTSVSRVADVSRYPMLLDITFTPEWERAALYQTLSSLERARSTDGPTFYTVPKDLVVARRPPDQTTPLSPADVVERASIATAGLDGSWTIRGRPEIPTSYLLRFKDRQVAQGTVLIVTGEIRRGEFLVGLLDGEQWNGNVAVGERGPFVVAVEAPRDGKFGVLLTADLKPRWPASHIGHRIGPLVEWLPGATLWSDLVLEKLEWVDRKHGDD
jgi:hypothetical protein